MYFVDILLFLIFGKRVVKQPSKYNVKMFINSNRMIYCMVIYRKNFIVYGFHIEYTSFVWVKLMCMSLCVLFVPLLWCEGLLFEGVDLFQLLS